MISLNYRDARPIYEQLKDKLRRLILSGAIAQDERLPSVRELASELMINSNTIMRAYRELEAEGYVYTIQGKGSFAGSLKDVDDGRKAQMRKTFSDSARELIRLGVSMQELHEILKQEVEKL